MPAALLVAGRIAQAAYAAFFERYFPIQLEIVGCDADVDAVSSSVRLAIQVGSLVRTGAFQEHWLRQPDRRLLMILADRAEELSPPVAPGCACVSVFAPVAAIRQALSALMPEVEWATELRETPRNDRETTRVESLSRRESELWPLLARGLTLREAALRLEISYKTADSYRTNLLRKLGLRNRMELARLAIRLGMMPA